jgi:hypothetical protein
MFEQWKRPSILCVALREFLQSKLEALEVRVQPSPSTRAALGGRIPAGGARAAEAMLVEQLTPPIDAPSDAVK